MTVLRLTRPFTLATALLLASVPAWALYKVVGPNGEITYTDRPPVDAKKSQPVKVAGDSGPSTDGLPYQLQQLVSRYPVILYSSTRCSPCDSGRLFLTRRGIPFTEKTVNSNEDLKAYSAQLGTDQLPLLKIGNQQLRGYAEQEWSEYLTAAGYPEQSSLPSSYKAPAATPLVAPAPTKDTNRAAPSAAPNPSTSAPPAGNAPPGFRF
ncbi:MAG: DUF4124 domain-containing protein [Burkholderiales bacterium]|nr:DUF4124 domain-containing protein [Burkholderiales bacterium]